MERIARYLGGRAPRRILDLGCGNHSPQYFHAAFPDATYVGVDRGSYGNTDDDRRAASRILDVDLESGGLEELPDATFDLVVLSHLLEHLHDPDRLLRVAIRKVAPDGWIYLAFPHPASVGFPHHRGTLNFHDDPTHVTVVHPEAVEAILSGAGLVVVRSERGRSARNLLLMPVRAALSPVTGEGVGPSLWDLYRFEQVVVARRGTSDS